MRLVLAVFLFCHTAFGLQAEEVFSGRFKLWLSDDSIPLDRDVHVSLTLEEVSDQRFQVLADAAELLRNLEKDLPAINVVSVEFWYPGAVLYLNLHKSHLKKLWDSPPKNLKSVLPKGDLGHLNKLYVDLNRMKRAYLETGDTSSEARSKKMQEMIEAMSGEFNLKNDLLPEARLALAAAILDTAHLDYQIEPMVSRIAGYRAGNWYRNDVHVLAGSPLPAKEGFLYVRIHGAGATADGYAWLYRKLPLRADATEYVFAGFLPKGYSYVRDPKTSDLHPEYDLELAPGVQVDKFAPDL